MSTKPLTVALWDTNLTNAVAVTGAHITDGYDEDETPTSGEFNYELNLIGKWCQYLNDGNLTGGVTVDTLAVTGDMTFGGNVHGLKTVDDAAIGAPLTFSRTFTVDHTTGLFTVTSHGLHSWDGPFRFTNVGGALPTNLITATDYWVVVNDANTFFLNIAFLNTYVLSPSNVIVTNNGSGTNTMTSTASTRHFANISVVAQATADRVLAREYLFSGEDLYPIPMPICQDGTSGTQSAGVATLGVAGAFVAPIVGVPAARGADSNSSNYFISSVHFGIGGNGVADLTVSLVARNANGTTTTTVVGTVTNPSTSVPLLVVQVFTLGSSFVVSSDTVYELQFAPNAVGIVLTAISVGVRRL